MKKIALFLSLLALTFTASAEVPFGDAWSHIASFASYWVGIGIALVVSAGLSVYIKRRVGRYGWDTQAKSIIGLILIVILFAMLAPVAECAANSFVTNGVTTYIR